MASAARGRYTRYGLAELDLCTLHFMLATQCLCHGPLMCMLLASSGCPLLFFARPHLDAHQYPSQSDGWLPTAKLHSVNQQQCTGEKQLV
jgi:hypothetical protein